MQRSAHQVEAMATQCGIENWSSGYRRKKYNFAGKVARQTDNRWSRLAVSWTPNGGSGRNPGQPVTRWSDDLERFATGAWATAALDIPYWRAAEDGFATRL